ncbi:MAG: S1 RNA-binding domain-containing protein [Clostridia bacterium]|nr:S1 RNA-binding domain-containing protein [Clostridia bacterium]
MMSYLPEGFLINTKENKLCLSSIESFTKAYYEKTPLEQRVNYCDCEHNLHIDFGFIHGIIPREECAIGISEGTTRDIAIIARVNKPVRFIIDEIKETADGKLAILSRKKLQTDFTENVISKFLPGDIIDAKVTHIENFGVFCDIGCGINGLLPIDNISVSRIPHPSVRFSTGDNIKVIIKSFDDYGRVTLTHKELLGTWEENARFFNVGETVSGIVRSIENYGVFVELTPNLSGLAEYTPNVTEGQHTSVFIKSIIPEKMKFKLIIVDSFDAEYPRKKPHYFLNEGHIDTFRYSPENCIKNIETTF